jgi:uncharacterized membrane protein
VRKSAIFTILWAWLFLGEERLQPRLLGTVVMLVGGIRQVHDAVSCYAGLYTAPG